MRTENTGFEEFWRAYPKKVARDEAMRAFRRALDQHDFAKIIHGAERYAAERRSEDPRFTKHPATWLSKSGWLDQPDATIAAQSERRTGVGSIDRGEPGLEDRDFDEVLAKIQQRQRSGY